jgi:uncharacterized membrane protein (DUF441 family)
MNFDDIKTALGAMIALFSAWLGGIADWIVSFFQIPPHLTFPLTMGIIQTDVMLQRIVWTIGILAGIVSIVNGCKSWKIWRLKQYKKKKK